MFDIISHRCLNLFLLLVLRILSLPFPHLLSSSLTFFPQLSFSLFSLSLSFSFSYSLHLSLFLSLFLSLILYLYLSFSPTLYIFRPPQSLSFCLLLSRSLSPSLSRLLSLYLSPLSISLFLCFTVSLAVVTFLSFNIFFSPNFVLIFSFL